jgi:hypothetical protein
MDTLPRALWRWNVELERVADLRSSKALAALGLARPRAGRDDWPPFQRTGEALREAGWPALVAPSAARADGLVLCVFRSVAGPPGVEPCPPHEHVDEPLAPPRGMRT